MTSDNFRMTFDLFLHCLRECADDMDETEFFYRNEAGEDVYCILGYITKHFPERPYWTGHGCDVDGGMEFASADELVEAKIYGGKSIRERWGEIRVDTLAMCDPWIWLRYRPFAEKTVTPEGVECWRLKARAPCPDAI